MCLGQNTRLHVSFSHAAHFSECAGRVSQGVPIRLELGAKDMEAGSCALARRDTGAKETCALADVATRVPALLEQIQARPIGF